MTKLQWLSPTMTILSNDAIQTGMGGSTFYETLLLCDGPVLSLGGVDQAGVDDPDCGAVTGTGTYNGSPYVSLTGQITEPNFTASCVGNCS